MPMPPSPMPSAIARYADLIEAGGLDAILPQGFASLVSDTGAERSVAVDALTRVAARSRSPST